MDLDKLKKFLDESPIYIAVYGDYQVGLDLVIRSFEEYLETGYNPIREHSSLTHIQWYGDDDNYDIHDKDLALMHKCIKDETFWNWSNFFESKEQLEYIYNRRVNKKRLAKSYSQRRKKASRHISKKEIREAVFERDEYTCKMCESKSNLTIDHIIPVVRGGGDEIENLQCLCKSCNSKKGSK